MLETRRGTLSNFESRIGHSRTARAPSLFDIGHTMVDFQDDPHELSEDEQCRVAIYAELQKVAAQAQEHGMTFSQFVGLVEMWRLQLIKRSIDKMEDEMFGLDEDYE